jgi:CBS domain containing-hemolysin-like protein
MTGTEVLGIIAVVVLVLAAAVLALAETALTHLGRARAVALEEEGRRGARLLVGLVEHRDRALNPVLLLLLTCHLGAATIVAIIVDRHFGLGGLAIAFVLELVVIFVVAEAAPKIYALLETDRSATAVAPLVQALVLFAPLRWVTRLLIGMANVIIPGRGRKTGPAVSEEELLALAGVAVESDVIEPEERVLIESIIEFGDTVVREVMIPRPDMITVSGEFRVGDAMEVVILNGYSRLPVSGEGIDDIVGIVFAKDLMRAERDGKADLEVRQLMRPAQFVPETKRVSALLREMQAEQYHMAIVVDEYGGTAGLVTLEDLIEELVGEIVDEYDVEEPVIEPLPGGDVRVNARMHIDEVNDLIHADLPEGDWDTVGGLLFSLLGHVPVEGESVEVDGHRLRAEKVQGRRIGRVRISRVAAGGDDADDRRDRGDAGAGRG